MVALISAQPSPGTGARPTRPYPPPVTPSPDALLQPGTHGPPSIRWGTFAEPVGDVDLLGNDVGRTARWLRLKEWQAFQFGNAEWVLCGAVYNSKSIALLQLIAAHLPTGEAHRWLVRTSPNRTKVAHGLRSSVSAGSARGMSVRIDNRCGESAAPAFAVHVEHRGSRKTPPMTFTAQSIGQPPHLVIAHPFEVGPRRRPTTLYSDKSVGGASGTLSFDDTDVRFDADDTFLIVDDHKGQYPVPMRYDWVTAAAVDESLGVVGLNLTHNQIRTPEVYNENALWLDGSVHRLPAVRFERPQGVRNTWRVHDQNGAVDVSLTPQVHSDIHVGPGRVLAEYFGPYGTVTGTVELADGRVVDVSGMTGMGEQKRIRA